MRLAIPLAVGPTARALAWAALACALAPGAARGQADDPGAPSPAQGPAIDGVTRAILADLREPVAVLAYVSTTTHPALAPLLPELDARLRAFAAASPDRVTVSIRDPDRDPAADEEARARYALEPLAFQLRTERFEGIQRGWLAIVVVHRGRERALDTMEIVRAATGARGEVQAALADLEVALLRATVRLAREAERLAAALASLERPVEVTGFCSERLADTVADADLAERLRAFAGERRAAIEAALGAVRATLGERVVTRLVDPSAGPEEAAVALRAEAPSSAIEGIAGTFYGGVVIASGERRRAVPVLGGEPSAPLIASAVLRGVAWVAAGGARPRVGLAGGAVGFEKLRAGLDEHFDLRPVDLTARRALRDLDALIVARPRALDSGAAFALEQAVLAGIPAVLLIDRAAERAADVAPSGEPAPPADPADPAPADAPPTRPALTLEPIVTGLEGWLERWGIAIGPDLVLDPACLAIPGVTTVNGRPMAIHAPYPWLVEATDLDPQSPATAVTARLALLWASPLRLDPRRQPDARYVVLARSSAASWCAPGLVVDPDPTGRPVRAPEGVATAAHALAVSVRGRLRAAPAGGAVPDPNLAAPPLAEGRGRLLVMGDADLLSDLGFDDRSPLAAARDEAVRFLDGVIEWAQADDRLLDLAERRSRDRWAEAAEAPAGRAPPDAPRAPPEPAGPPPPGGLGAEGGGR